MKRKILTTVLFCLTGFAYAGAQTVQVIYEIQPKPAANVSRMKIAGVDQSVLDDIVKSVSGIKRKFCFCYSDSESLFRNMKSDKGNEIEFMGMKIDMDAQMGDDITYRNHKTKREIQQKNFLGKDFLIESELKADEWNIADSTKKILNYVCTKATSKTDSTVIWFCKNVPVSDGPVYSGLSGLVLQVIRKEAIITAIKVSDELSCEIKAPVKGAKTTKDEYKKMVEKRMNALQF
ncbi:MAG: GLPGLI family protein [Prevotellaceae bacterium]|jgi:GLPGLI family protein|nr:GLPGLI family protein [Prevotellaceae bacterium]